MPRNTERPVIYVISDLHIGGDEQIGHIDFLDELLGFLSRLEETDEDAELVINGDAFGLWEITSEEGLDKLISLIDLYPGLFEQFRRTGENIDITLLPGNHDHELAAYDGCREKLGEYNINLDRSKSITRSIDGYHIWFEHGHQQDPNNRIEDFGNPYSKPLGYFYNTHITSVAGKISKRGRYNWLKDIQAVTPTQMMPIWMVSKYFYREMNPALRYFILPFLLLFNISILLALLAALEIAGFWSLPSETIQTILGYLGPASNTAYVILAINAAVAGVLLLIAIPLYFIQRDIKITLDRFGIMEMNLTVDPEEPYQETARKVFDENPGTKVFCYGHTHRPKIRDIGNGLIVNTGTWLKRLHRREVFAGFLPPVFYPSYQLCIARIHRRNNELIVDFEEVKKKNPIKNELTITERALTLFWEPSHELPEKTSIDLEEQPEKTPLNHESEEPQ